VHPTLELAFTDIIDGSYLKISHQLWNCSVPHINTNT